MRFLLIAVATTFSLGAPIGDSVADTVAIDLEYRTDTLQWSLFAEVVDTGSVENIGDYGLSAVRALLDNVDFGLSGEAVTLASGIGAIDPIDAGGPNERPAVLQTVGGTLDIIYGQDLAAPESVVGGVGVGGRSLIANGSFASAVTPPAFGDDDHGYTTDGNFLDVAAPGPFGNSVPWGGSTLNVLDITPMGLLGDYNNNNLVDAADYTVWRDSLGEIGAGLPADGDENGVVNSEDYDLWVDHYGDSALSTLVQVPEPAAATLLATAAWLATGGATRRRDG